MDVWGDAAVVLPQGIIDSLGGGGTQCYSQLLMASLLGSLATTMSGSALLQVLVTPPHHWLWDLQTWSYATQRVTIEKVVSTNSYAASIRVHLFSDGG